MKASHNLIMVVIALLASGAIYLGSRSSGTEVRERVLQASVNYNTNPNRSLSVTTACVGRNRNNMISASSQAETESYKAQMAAQFTFDPNVFVSNLFNNQSQASVDMITSNTSPWALFIGPFMLGLFLIMILWPFLCCCCCCTSCCPSQCCQKPESEQYSQCELIWPGVILILALLLACVSGILGFTRSSNLTNGIANVACSGFILFDDFMNGNVTSDGQSFFIGVSTLVSQLTVFNNSIDAISTTLNSLSASSTFMTNTQATITTAVLKVSEIPSGAANGTLTLSYNTPINTPSPTTPLTSSFVQVIGSEGNTSSLVGQTTATINGLGTSLSLIGAAVDAFAGSIASFKLQVGTVQTTASGFLTQLIDIDESTNDIYTQMETVLEFINVGMSAFFSVVIVLSILGILGLVLMTFCSMFKCRYLIYLVCVIMFVIGIIGFIIATLFSVIVPVIYIGCQWISFSLASPANFNSNTQGFLDSSTASFITTCFASSSGDIISVLAPEIATTLNSATGSITNVSSFNSSSVNTQITDAWNAVGFSITQVLDSVLPDLDVAQIDILVKISDKNNFGCSDSKFASDSWITSTNVNQTGVPCLISGGANVSTPCSTADFGAGSGGCAGCMDTTKILDANASAANALTALNTRYTSADCSTFNNQLADSWGNYYLPKKTAMTLVQTRYNAANTSVASVITAVTTTIPTTFAGVITSLTNTADTITNPTTGLIAGINCRIIGEDITRFVNVFCLEAFNNMYFLRLVLGVASFGILFAMCCSVCVGVRHYKHSERISKIQLMESHGSYANQQQPYNNYGNAEQTNGAFIVRF